MEKGELKVRLSRENADFIERYAAAHQVTTAKAVDLSLSLVRERERRKELSEQSRATFDALAEEWREATRYMSSLTDMIAQPAYQRIVGMGTVAIPLLLAELDREPHHWFWALKAITGEDPVTEEIRGDIAAMSRTWLTWGRQHGYC